MCQAEIVLYHGFFETVILARSSKRSVGAMETIIVCGKQYRVINCLDTGKAATPIWPKRLDRMR